MNATGPSEIRTWMRHYFQADQSDSPLQGQNSDNSRLTDAIAGYMRNADGGTLHRLFYEPDVETWRTLYQSVASKRQFSALDLVTWLDETKTEILRIYATDIQLQNSNRMSFRSGANENADEHNTENGIKREFDGEAYLYIPTLLDNAMQQIFAGCWGISDEPTPAHVIDRLKGVYGRVVSGFYQVDRDNAVYGLAKSLEEKKQGPLSSKKGHFAVLQECAAAVIYNATPDFDFTSLSMEDILSFGFDAVPNEKDHATLKEENSNRVSKFIKEFTEKTQIALSQSSCETTFEKIKYQNPLEAISSKSGVFQQIMSILLYGEDDEAKINKYVASLDSNQDVLVDKREEHVRMMYGYTQYGWGENVLLTPAQLHRIMTRLATDKKVPLKDKTQILVDALSHPTTIPEAISQALFDSIEPSISEAEIMGVFAALESFSGPFNYNKQDAEKLQRLRFVPAQQDRLLNLYEQALSKEKDVLTKWEDLFRSPFFSSDKVLSKAAAACQILKTTKPEAVRSFLSRHQDKCGKNDEATKQSVEAMLKEIPKPQRLRRAYLSRPGLLKKI